MKSYVLAIALLGAASASPSAAQSVASPPPPFSWSGFYVGGTVGYGQANFDDVWQHTYDEEDDYYGPVGGQERMLTVKSGDGLLASAKIGYNYEINDKLFVGLETDISWSGVDRGKSTVWNSAYGVVLGETSSRLRWLATVRPRLGVHDGPALIYVTAGLAYGSVQSSSGSFILGADPYDLGKSMARYNVSTDEERFGWAAGFGAEYALSSHWIMTGEFLYVDLNGSSYYDRGRTSLSLETSIAILRGGLAYKF